MKISSGNLVTIASQNVQLIGVVRTANNYGRDGEDDWYIEFDVDGINRYWKQHVEGGQIVEHRILNEAERRIEIALSFSRVHTQSRLTASDANRLLRILRGFQATAQDYVQLDANPTAIQAAADVASWHPKLRQLRQHFSDPLFATLRHE